MKPTLLARQWASSVSERAVMSTSPTRIVPLSALSIPARRFKRVVFPNRTVPSVPGIHLRDVEGDIVQNRDGEVFR